MSPMAGTCILRAPAHHDNKPLYEYALMPTHIRSFFSTDELKTAELVEPFSFTKGVRPLKVEARPWIKAFPSQTAHGCGQDRLPATGLGG
jgi:hypothetical protein